MLRDNTPHSLNPLRTNQKPTSIQHYWGMPGHAISSPNQWRYTSTPATSHLLVHAVPHPINEYGGTLAWLERSLFMSNTSESTPTLLKQPLRLRVHVDSLHIVGICLCLVLRCWWEHEAWKVVSTNWDAQRTGVPEPFTVHPLASNFVHNSMNLLLCIIDRNSAAWYIC